MKLIQLNIWGGRLEKPLLNFLKEQNPDILCLQEAIDIKQGKSAMYAATEEIQTAINAQNIFFSPVFSFNYMNRKADFGNCIITKLPIIGEHSAFTGKEYIPDFDWLEHDPNMRNFQHATLKTPHGNLNILNHHGHHIDSHKNGDDESMRQCKLIADYIAKLDSPTILAGDFNLGPYSESIGQLNSLLINQSISHGLKTTRTSLTHKQEVCDYVFTSKDIKVVDFAASDDMVSDHKALILEFEL